MTVGTDWGREVSVHPTTTPVFDKTYHENINGDEKSLIFYLN